MHIRDLDGYKVVSPTDGQDLQKAIEIINSGKANGLLVHFTKNWPKNLETLKGLNNPLYLNVQFFPGDYSAIHNLQSLETLNIFAVGGAKVDYSCFPALKKTALEWHKSSKSLFSVSQLESLYLGKYSGKDLAEFRNFKKLKYLRLNTGSVVTLGGIDELKSLESLYLAQVTKLIDLSPMTKMTKIEHLTIDNCAKIATWGKIDFYNHIKDLHIRGTTPKIPRSVK